MSDLSDPASLALPVPKHKIGDKLYWPGTKTEHVEHACPDCGGAEKWHVKTAVAEFDVPCQRCRSYGKQPARTLTSMRHVPIVNSMTVEAIKAECNSRPGQRGRAARVSYGSGSGSVDEDKLLAAEAEALALAVVMAAKENVALDVRADEVRKREIAEMDLRDALAAEQDDQRRKAERKYENAINAIEYLKEGYVSGFGDKRTDDCRLECVARHLLNELDEPVPGEWGDD